MPRGVIIAAWKWVAVCSVIALIWGLIGGGSSPVLAEQVVRKPLGPGVFATLKHGRPLSLGIECHVPPGEAGKTRLEQYLADEGLWEVYKDRLAVFIPMLQLKEEVRREVLLAVFESDRVDERGWTHTVLDARDTLWTLCEHLTGDGQNYRKVMAANGLRSPDLKKGQRVLVPAALLLDAMKAPETTGFLEPAVDLDAAARDLVYGSDSEGAYAAYRLKEGEALYTAVAVRFTDFRDHEYIEKACRTIQGRSGIRDVCDIKPGTLVRIPAELLSDRFKPPDSPERRHYEASIQEAERLKESRTRRKQLDGVVVILDPGHGGRDYGAANKRLGLYEDELNYDIACRIKRLLETQTRATVYMTLIDVSQGYVPVDKKRFTHDADEELLTHPRYCNGDARMSANLRWYLANSYYRSELAKGVDERNVIFTSLHTDALFNKKLRGAMVYLPGAKLCGNEERPRNGGAYKTYREYREQPVATSTQAERRRNEALSRNFAAALLESMGKHNPPLKRHKAGDPIRTQIRRNGGRSYVPAVLRGTAVPTKVLAEVANMTNPTDCARLADPDWREWFAEAYVDALKAHFGA